VDSNPDKSAEDTANYLKQDPALVRQAGKQNLCTGDMVKHVDELNRVMLNLGLAKAPIDAAKAVWR
jgi:hypothetical protein